MRVFAIAAADEKLGIGVNGDLPWRIPEDMQFFKEKTEGHSVLMGRKTFASLPPKFCPLPKRLNIVCTRDENYELPDGVIRGSDPLDFLTRAKAGDLELDFPSDIIWVIGGAEIYNQTLSVWDELFFTQVHSSYDADAFFPQFQSDFRMLEETPREGFSFQRYVR